MWQGKPGRLTHAFGEDWTRPSLRRDSSGNKPRGGFRPPETLGEVYAFRIENQILEEMGLPERPGMKRPGDMEELPPRGNRPARPAEPSLNLDSLNCDKCKGVLK